MTESILYSGWVENKELRYKRLCQSMAIAFAVRFGKEGAYKIVSTCVEADWERTYRNMVQKHKSLTAR